LLLLSLIPPIFPPSFKFYCFDPGLFFLASLGDTDLDCAPFGSTRLLLFFRRCGPLLRALFFPLFAFPPFDVPGLFSQPRPVVSSAFFASLSKPRPLLRKLPIEHHLSTIFSGSQTLSFPLTDLFPSLPKQVTLDFPAGCTPLSHRLLAWLVFLPFDFLLEYFERYRSGFFLDMQVLRFSVDSFSLWIVGIASALSAWLAIKIPFTNTSPEIIASVFKSFPSSF